MGVRGSSSGKLTKGFMGRCIQRKIQCSAGFPTGHWIDLTRLMEKGSPGLGKLLPRVFPDIDSWVNDELFDFAAALDL